MEKEKNNYKDLKTDVKILAGQEGKTNQDNLVGEKLKKNH